MRIGPQRRQVLETDCRHELDLDEQGALDRECVGFSDRLLCADCSRQSRGQVQEGAKIALGVELQQEIAVFLGETDRRASRAIAERRQFLEPGRVDFGPMLGDDNEEIEHAGRLAARLAGVLLEEELQDRGCAVEIDDVPERGNLGEIAAPPMRDRNGLQELKAPFDDAFGSQSASRPAAQPTRLARQVIEQRFRVETIGLRHLVPF